ncbi:MAG: hypothetical protein D6727_10105 [Gammaproteobacteria bacterium]|nr:MAG: hypothetical protein D6727_10105 [Gammaproteobacteria bacterium]
MERPQRILAAIPPTELGAEVAGRAAELARRFRAELRLSGCVYDPYVAGERFADSPDLQAARQALVEQRREALQALAAGLGELPAIDVEAVWAYPIWQGIIDAAARFDAGLIVAGTHHHSLLQRLTLSNTDWQLIRHVDRPLLLVRGDHFRGYGRVLAAVDPMHRHDEPAELDDRLLAAAATMAAPWQGEVHLIHCYLAGESLPLVAPGAVLPAGYLERSSPAEAHRQAAAALARRHGLPEQRLHLLAGDPRRLIPELAERLGAGLVVTGAVSRSRLEQLLIGSTAEAVLDALDCDVLVIKPAAAG